MPEESLQLYSKEFIKEKNSSQNPGYVFDFLIYEPKNIEEAQLGTLFMLGKIENVPKNKYKNFDFLLNLIISVIRREFYSSPSRSSLEALEASLNKANLYLADFAEKGNIEWINNLHFACGVFYQNTIHIAQTGDLLIKLIRETTISHIEKKFPSQKKIHPLNTFSNIASGTIANGDKIILGTRNTLEAISINNLKVLSKKNCDYIIRGLEELTKDKDDKLPFICLVLEARRVDEKEIATQLSQPEHEETLLKKKKNKFLKAKPIILKIFSVFRKISIIIFLLIYKLISLIVYLLKSILKKTGLLKRVKSGISKLVERSGVKEKYYKLKKEIILIKDQKIRTFYNQNKLAFFVASALILLILILPFFVVQKVNYYAKMSNFNELADRVQEFEKKTDTALIYQNKDRAKALIQKNQALVAELLEYSQKSPLRDNNQVVNKLALLKKKYQNQQDAINKVIRIENLNLILDFSKTGFIVNPVGIAQIKNYLYFYELDSGILYKFPTTDNSLSEKKDEKNNLTLIFISAKDELRKMTPLENGQIVLLGQSKKVYIYNSQTNDYDTYLLNPAIAIENIKNLGSFLSNFYILNSSQGNIIKYSLSETEKNVIQGKNWLPEPKEELKTAQSMAIDGSIYILTNGRIAEYFKGKKVKEIQPKLAKPLGGNNKIFIKSNFKNFYISDPKNKRLIILNKQGEIINQYVNDEFINLKDFWVTKNEKEVYLLCRKKVFRLEF